MYAPLFFVLLVFAGALTYQFGVRGESSFFAALVAFVLWAFLAFQTEIQAVSGGDTIAFELVPSLRLLFAGFALIAAFEVLWQLLGTDDSMTATDEFAMER